MIQLVIVIIGLLFSLSQVSMLPHFGILTHLDLVGLLLACELAFRRHTEALWVALVCGLTLDFFTSLPLGSWLSALVIALALTALLSERLKLGHDLGSLILRLIVIQVLSTSWILGVTLLSGGSSNALAGAIRELIWQVPITTLALLIFYLPIRRLYRFLEYWQPKIQVARK